jgi:hypothetical protein
VKGKKMTTFEIWTLFGVGLAILISIISPFITYYFLNPELKSFRNRGRLKVESGNEITKHTIPANPPEIPEAIDYLLARKDWNLIVTNIGNMPAKEVQIVFRYTSLGPGEKPNPEVTVDPPTPFELSTEGNELTLRLKRAIAVGDGINVTVRTDPDWACAYNEFGEGTCLETSEGRKRWRDLFATPTPSAGESPREPARKEFDTVK